MLSLGKHSYVGQGLRIGVYARRDAVVNVGKYCSIAENVTFMVDGNHSSDTVSTFPFHELLHFEVPPNGWGKATPSVGNDVWIALGAVIHSGVHIGNGAVVAGQAVVTKSVPPYAIVAGNPARVVRFRFTPEQICQLEELKWWDMPDARVKSLMEGHYYDVQAFIAAARRN